MANERITVFGTTHVLESNGASIASGAVGEANDDTYDVVADGGGYPEADFALGCAFSSAPAQGELIYLYARALDIDGTNDAEVPQADRPGLVIGYFAVKNMTATQFMPLVGVRDLPRLAGYWLHNATGQGISAGWTLKLTPRTDGTA
jgi:hypothetical protein